MDARSGLDLTNKAIKQKLNTIRQIIRNEKPAQPENPDQEVRKLSAEYERHRQASQLFYYCLMLAYGDLMAQAMLNRLDRDVEPNAEDKYHRHYQRTTHRLTELQRLMDGQVVNAISEKATPEKREQPGSKRGRDYNAIIKQFEKELAAPGSDGFQAVMAHVMEMNVAFMKMSTIFFNDHLFKDYQEDHTEKDKAAENEKKNAAMLLLIKKLLTVATAVDFIFELEYLVKHYALKQSSYLTVHAQEFQFFEKLFSDDQEAVEAESPASFQPLFDDLKKMFNEDDYRGIEDIVGDFKEKCNEYGFVSCEVIDDELRDQFNEKLRELKKRYLGKGGEFDNIEAVAMALNNNEALPVDQHGRLAAYANYLKERRQPMLRRPRMDTHAIDSEIDSMLDSLSPSKQPSVPLTRTRSNSQSDAPPGSSPAMARKRSRSHVASLAGAAESPVTPVKTTPAATADNVVSQEPTTPTATRPSVVLTPPDLAVSNASPPLRHLRPTDASKKLATVDYRRPNHGSPMQFKPAIKMPNLAKYLLIGIGIGLLVSVLAAGAVALAYFAIHGGAAVLVPAFIATAKLLGGSTIGTWSLVASILACPPVMGLLSAFSQWKHRCESLFSPGSTPTIVRHSNRRAGEPVPSHSVEMRPSQKLREERLPSVVNNPNTKYARAGSQKRVDVPAGEQTPFIRRGSRPG